MIARRQAHRRRCVTYIFAVYCDVYAIRIGIDGNCRKVGSGGSGGCCGHRCCCWRRCGVLVELCSIDVEVAIHVDGYFGSFWNGDVPSVDEEEQRRGGKKHDAGSNNCSRHPPNGSAALSLLDAPQRNLFAIGETKMVKKFR